MITFVSLNTIISDLMNVIRGAKISQSETISRRQVEAWVHQYRALLIKRDIDAGKVPNPDYIQTIPSVPLAVVDKTTDSSTLDSDTYLLRTTLELPNTIDFNHKSGFMYVGTIDGKEIQFVPEGRSSWQQYKRFTSSEAMAFLRDKKIYINHVTPLSEVTVRGIFEIPTEVSNFVNANSTVVTSDLDDRYPVPANWVSTIKEMILQKELQIESRAYSDDKNDGVNKVSPNNE